MSWPLLSLLVFTPLAGAVAIWLLPARAARHIVALAMVLAVLLATAVLLAYDPPGARFQMIERVRWIASLNVDYLLGIDGISVLFLPATALLFLGALVASWNTVK